MPVDNFSATPPLSKGPENGIVYSFWMWVARRLLPKGYGIIRVEGHGCSCVGLSLEERDVAGVNLVPLWYIEPSVTENDAEQKAREKAFDAHARR